MWQQIVSLAGLNESQQSAWQQVLARKRLDELAADQIEAWRPAFEESGLASLSAERIEALGGLIAASKNKTASEIRESEYFASGSYRFISGHSPTLISAFADLTLDDVRAFGVDYLADLTDEEILFFRQLRELMSESEITLEVPERGVKPLADKLRENTTWTSLSIIHAGGDLDTAEIIDALEENDTLRMLSLDCGTFGATGLLMLAELLTENASLQSLSVKSHYAEHAQTSDDHFGNVALRKFAKALPKNTTLQALKINRPHIEHGRDGDFSPLVLAIARHPALKKVDLSECNLSVEQIIALFNAMQANTTIEQLNLDGNDVDKTVGLVLAKLLRENHTLSYLGLAHAYWHSPALDDKEAIREAKQAIYDALISNEALRKLSGLGVEDELSEVNDGVAKEDPLDRYGLANKLSAQEQVRLAMVSMVSDAFNALVNEFQIKYGQPGTGDVSNEREVDDMPKLGGLLARNQQIYQTNQANVFNEGLVFAGPSPMFSPNSGPGSAGGASGRPTSPGPGQAF